MEHGYLPRVAEERVRRALGALPVVVLTGARQTGKTTLARHLDAPASRLFLTLDDTGVLGQAQSDADSLLSSAAHLTLDEVQRAPELLLAVKRAVDRDRRRGRFLLTGSANLLLLRSVSETLAGRAAYVVLGPMTESEKRGSPSAGPWPGLLGAPNVRAAMEICAASESFDLAWPAAVLEGGFPAAVLETPPEERDDWFEGYVRTYLERDLRQISQITELVDFRRLMRLAALRVGSLQNQSALGRDVALPQPTAHRYLNLLEASHLLHRLPAFAARRAKRLIKMPKLYWADTGLAAFLSGIRDPSELRRRPEAGAFLENLVFVHLATAAEVARPRPDLLFWRTPGGQEVDFILERGDRLLPIEVKAASHVGPGDLGSLETFLDLSRGRAPFGLILYTGADLRLASSRVIALPIAKALGRAG